MPVPMHSLRARQDQDQPNATLVQVDTDVESARTYWIEESY
ncbi:MAG: hypothetical protein ACJAWL_001991 [Motiliproteus sp.]|jgi:hypothetical protein